MADDIRETPYAHWLEKMCETVMETRPVMACVCMMSEDATVITGYYGDMTPQDKMFMACHINMDATFEIAKANAKEIVEAAEEDEDDG